ncbi:MAG: hypothetical protein HY748_03760 [Elusimicrobia bacterium]|nr:hypothetical protein [Elusimicrobiota bacterium]
MPPLLLLAAGALAGESPSNPQATSTAAAQAGEFDPIETRVTIKVKNAPLASYLETISAQAKINFVLADGLDGVRVTAFLNDVTVRDALELLRVTKGLTYRRTGSGGATLIAPASKKAPERRTKVHRLKNAVPRGP